MALHLLPSKIHSPYSGLEDPTYSKIPLSLNLSTILSIAHCSPMLSNGCLLFLTEAKSAPTSGPLHLQLPLTGEFFYHISSWLTSLLCSNIILEENPFMVIKNEVLFLNNPIISISLNIVNILFLHRFKYTYIIHFMFFFITCLFFCLHIRT